MWSSGYSVHLSRLLDTRGFRPTKSDETTLRGHAVWKCLPPRNSLSAIITLRAKVDYGTKVEKLIEPNVSYPVPRPPLALS